MQQKHQIPVVLVVDDDELIRLLAQESLSQADFNVVVAGNGDTALKLLRQAAPDVILIDVELPEQDGFELCRTIRDLPEHEDTPIVMLTGYDTAAIDRAYAMRATDFETKPIQWALLPYKLRDNLHRAMMKSKLTQTTEELKKSRDSLMRAQRIAHLGIWTWCPLTSTLWCSDEVYRILGVEQNDFEPCLNTMLAYLPETEREAFKDWCHDVCRGEREPAIRQRIYCRDGEERVVLIQAERIVETDGGIGLSGTFQDVTDHQQAARRIHQLAYYDPLTDLPNRISFREQLGRAIAHAKRRGEALAVLYLDLDEFKHINDTLGHSMGDELLKTVGTRLLSALRAGDVVTRWGTDDDETAGAAARFGGDEFAVLLEGLDSEEGAAVVAQRICETMTDGFILGTHEVFVTPSIGIAMSPRDGEDVETLLKHADTAMYVAKRSGKNAYRFFDDTMNANAERRLEIGRELRRALDRDEFFLVYQPQMDLRSQTVEGAEALLRWKNQTFGLIPPDQFIPIAEDTGLIISLGEWTLKAACHQAKIWLHEGIGLSRIAVNISTLQFGRKDFVQLVTRILAESGLPAHMLELEITESLLAQDADRAVATLRDLKHLGVQLSIDDFGTGYSSLCYLKRFPVDRLKIDRSFVMDIDTDPDDAAIASAILGMAASMNLKVVAEGVETETQLDVLRDKQCDEIQGYLLSRPLDAKDMTMWLKEYGRNPCLALTACAKERY